MTASATKRSNADTNKGVNPCFTYYFTLYLLTPLFVNILFEHFALKMLNKPQNHLFIHQL
jgi:hypothetical protein